jgi:LacI family transcriptional regulator
LETIPKLKGISPLMSSRRYTISDIARTAGVGVGTVSRVLNDDPHVKEQTRQKIQKIIEKAKYQPSFTARSLRTQKTHVIGFIADAVATTPYAVNVIKGAQDAAWEHGKLLLVVDADNDSSRREAALETLIERKVEGIIYAAMFHQEVKLSERFHDVPTVLVDCFTKNHTFPSVVPDEVQGGQTATEQLLQKGHKRIGMITNDKLSTNYPAPKGRLKGYKQALKKARIPFDEKLFLEGDGSANTGYECTMKFMKLKRPPTAIFCCTDRMAMGAYDALKKLQRHIPDDVSVIGFDNQDVIANYLFPPLSTMALPHYEMGQWAVKYLLSETNSGNLDAKQQQILSCPFIERASIGSKWARGLEADSGSGSISCLDYTKEVSSARNHQAK